MWCDKWPCCPLFVTSYVYIYINTHVFGCELSLCKWVLLFFCFAVFLFALTQFVAVAVVDLWLLSYLSCVAMCHVFHFLYFLCAQILKNALSCLWLNIGHDQIICVLKLFMAKRYLYILLTEKGFSPKLEICFFFLCLPMWPAKTEFRFKIQKNIIIYIYIYIYISEVKYICSLKSRIYVHWSEVIYVHWSDVFMFIEVKLYMFIEVTYVCMCVSGRRQSIVWFFVKSSS